MKLSILLALYSFSLLKAQEKFSWKNVYFEIGRINNHYHSYAQEPSDDFKTSNWTPTFRDGFFPASIAIGYQAKKIDVSLSTFRDGVVMANVGIKGDINTARENATGDIYYFNALNFIYYPISKHIYQRKLRLGVGISPIYGKQWGGPFGVPFENTFLWGDETTLTYKSQKIEGVDFDLKRHIFLAGVSTKCDYELSSNLSVWANFGYNQGFTKVSSHPSIFVVKKVNVPPKEYRNTSETKGTHFFFQFGINVKPFKKFKLKP